MSTGMGHVPPPPGSFLQCNEGSFYICREELPTDYYCKLFAQIEKESVEGCNSAPGNSATDCFDTTITSGGRRQNLRDTLRLREPA
eukprot:scaffold7292_cov55-Phaeocystis_antarctica.AAC.1